MNFKVLCTALSFLFLLPLLSQAQVSSIQTGGTGYFLQTEHGDTLHLRGATPFYNRQDIAFIDGLNYAGENDVRVFLRNNIELRLIADFGLYDYEVIEVIVRDTVYVLADTVYIEVPGDTLYTEFDGLLNDFNYELRKNVSDDLSLITLTGVTQLQPERVDSINVRAVCSEAFYEWVDRLPHSSVFYHQWKSTCLSDMQVNLTMYTENEIGHRELMIPGFLFGDMPPDEPDTLLLNADNWRQIWRDNSTLETIDDGMVLTILERGSTAWINEDYFATSFDITMRADAAFHLRLFAREDGYAQDISYYGGGLHYAVWTPGSPGNTSNHNLIESYEIDFEPGRKTIRVQINEERVRAKIYAEQEGDVWMIDIETVLWDGAGYLGIGAHSTAVRKIEYLEVNPN